MLIRPSLEGERTEMKLAECRGDNPAACDTALGMDGEGANEKPVGGEMMTGGPSEKYTMLKFKNI